MVKLIILSALCVALSLYMGDASLETVQSLLTQYANVDRPMVKCPGSESFIHASCSTVVSVEGFSCTEVKEEILARIAGQHTGKWQDPHNNGKYKVIEAADDGSLLLSRRTGNDKYTDKMLFNFEDDQSGEKRCTLAACSESQVTSVADFSTNYCNLRNLYCGVTDHCPYVKYTLDKVIELQVKPSIGAGTSKEACLK